ncbi:hypothetical protein OPW33_24280 [Vibrio europaeus]|uniref:hypothetical protein n=1 Tax=Vibrio europaeus TaxID=300876 RepID=UPI0023410CAC|nr:hypothetical protein [Vibrio europaeus]MDC5840190.1 hypothetical protein [Vibrio europaeus]MDC5840209.1 hypothetical protein [Vibrio europaeus]MDC5842448.1 hypothetical protein [Vibrio europaeus]
MGGSSSSASNTTTNTSTTTNNESHSAAFNGDMSGHVISGAKNSTITLTDHGSVNKALEEIAKVTDSAFDFGTNAMKNHQNIFGQALEFASGASDSALDVAKNLSLDSDAATARDANKNMMFTAVAMAVAFGLFAMKKGK